MMTKQLQALENVCDKRHSAAMTKGLTEQQAASIVVVYLEGWIARQVLSCNKLFGQSLLEGYKA